MGLASNIFIFYFLLVLLPFTVFAVFTDVSNLYDKIPHDDEKWKQFSPYKRALSVRLSAYVTKFAFLVWVYHFILTVGLSLFCANEAINKLDIAVDLNYYTKTSIRLAEAYDAVQNAKYHESYYTWYHYDREDTTATSAMTSSAGIAGQWSGERRRLESNNDFVAVYHSPGSDWDNILTPAGLTNICLAEKLLLASENCFGPDVSTILVDVFDEECEYLTSFEDSLPLFGLSANAVYVEDHVDPSNPTSAVLLSFISTSCSLELDSVDDTVAMVETISSTGISYAQNDLIIDAFVQSGVRDVELSLIAMFVCVMVLSFSLGVRVLYSLVFILCIVFSLVISAGALPLFGFSQFSAFNALAIFVITGVGADSILVFVGAWQNKFEKARRVALAALPPPVNDDTGLDDSDRIDMLPLFPIILHHCYGSVIKALAFSVMTTVLSFMANMVSPIVVIAQLGAFMGIAMISYFVLLHLILIPAWVSTMKVCPGTTACSSRTKNKFLRMFGAFCRTNFLRIAGRFASGSSCVCVCVDPQTRKRSYSTNVSEDFKPSLPSLSLSSPNSSSSLVATPVDARKKQSRLLGCSMLAGALICLPLVVYGITSVVLTDFGLPLLFKEGVNISDLIYIAKNFKSDMLSLSGEDISGSQGPTSSAPPSFAPTFSHTTAPSLSPSISQAPTYSPSLSPSLSPISAAPSMGVSGGENDEKTYYTVTICYGVDIEKEHVDGDATAKVNANSFAPYAEQGLLTDTATLCEYLATNRMEMEVTMADADCIYNELMAVSSADISIYDRINLWMGGDNQRSSQVGVEISEGGKGTGNMGPENELLLTWLCQPITCTANVSSFYDNPGHALTMIDRWDNAFYDVSTGVAEVMDVASLTASEAWLFPLLSDQLVKALYISLSISIVGSLSLLFVATLNLRLAILIGFGMIFVIALSLFLHAVLFSATLDLIDIVVVTSFVGIIIDYPTHMAFNYEHDLKLRRRGLLDDQPRLNFEIMSGSFVTNSELDNEIYFHIRSFNYMRFTLLGPALTTIFSAMPLLSADFTLISKAGEYVVIMCVCTYLYVALVMPTLLRLVGESELPCRKCASGQESQSLLAAKDGDQEEDDDDDDVKGKGKTASGGRFSVSARNSVPRVAANDSAERL